MDDRPGSAPTGHRSRRAALQTAAALLALAAGRGRSAAEEATPPAADAGIGPLVIQGFGRGSLFRTQGSGPDLPPYTLILWDAADQMLALTERPPRLGGLVPTVRVLAAVGAAPEPPVAALVAPPAGTSDAEASGSVWVLTLTYASPGADPGAVTYQGDPVEAAAAVTRFGLRPAAAPNGWQDVGAGYLVVAGLPALT